MSVHPGHIIYPLGETAITIDWGNKIDEGINQFVLQIFELLNSNPVPGMIEAVPAYSTLTIYYDVFQLRNRMNNGQAAYEIMVEQVNKFLAQQASSSFLPGRIAKIPVCYDPEFGNDLIGISESKGLSIPELIKIHMQQTYRVYLIGFLPGFPYMGLTDERISMPRKPSPVKVLAGSVGIAGRQTGIYPFDSPGGWQIMGRTPITIFDPAQAEPALLKPGDRVQFFSITADEFHKMQKKA